MVELILLVLSLGIVWVFLYFFMKTPSVDSYYRDFVYSPDGKSFAFVAKRDWKWVVVKDWRESDKYDNIWFLKYSPDGNSFMFVAKKNGKHIVVKDNREIG